MIEAPIPNAPEGKYISQIPSPTNLLTATSALKSVGESDIKLYNFLKDRHPPIIQADNIVYNMGEATCMDYLYNYAYIYLDSLIIANPKSNIYLIGYHPWLFPDKQWGSTEGFFSAPTNIRKTTPHYFEHDIIGKVHDETEFHNDWDSNDWEWTNKNVRSVTKGVRCTFRASRGCPHGCKMCPVLKTYNRKVRRFSVDWVMEELVCLYEHYGVRQVGFLDDNLMFDRKWGKELLKRIIDYKFKGLELTFEEGLDVPTALDEELVSMLKQAHFTHVKLGVESFNPATLKFINKPYSNPAHAIQAIRLLQKYKLSPVCFICIGFPGDTEESIKKDIQLLTELKVKLRVQILWPYPGIDFQGKGLPTKTLKKLQCDAMYGTNSVAWRRKDKK
jgi:radical SAM superfamily enzyme YgiQ (UPF0313 family)